MPDKAAFRESVEKIVRQIPQGHVMTYGQIASLAGYPRGARVVGFIAHYGDPDLPWQRVVNRLGRVAPGYPGGMPAHQAELESEGLVFDAEHGCELERYQWWPPGSEL